MSDHRFVIEVRRGDWGFQAHVRDRQTDLILYVTEVYPTEGMAKEIARAWIDRQPGHPRGGRAKQAPAAMARKAASPGCRLFHVCPKCASPIPPDWQAPFHREAGVAVLVEWHAGWCAHCARYWVIRYSRPRADAKIPTNLKGRVSTMSGPRMTPPRPARSIEARLAEKAIFGRRGLAAPIGGGT
jgi:hypothetical protein